MSSSKPQRLKRRGTERFFNPRWPAWTVEHAEGLQSLFFVTFVVLLVHDVAFNALKTSNGRFISLVDTVNSVASFRMGLPKRGKSSTGRFVWIFVLSLICKFLSQTLVSVLLETTPVVLKGNRHLSSFVIGFAVVWLSPEDIVYSNVANSAAIRLLFAIATSIYKLRKSLFAVQASMEIGSSFELAVIVFLLAIDGNSVTRRIALWMERLRFDYSDGEVTKGIHDFFVDILSSFRTGIMQLLFEFLIPDVCVTSVIFFVGKKIMQDTNVEIRILLLIYFCWRQRAFQILAAIHRVTLCRKTCEPSISASHTKLD